MKKHSIRKFAKSIYAFGLSAVMIFSNMSGMFPGIGIKETTALAATKQEQYELVDNVQDAAILHCWNWSYKTIEENLQLIAECGYSAVQTSPATQPKDYTWEGVVGTDVGTPGVGGTGNWWKLYQPVTESVCDNGQTWLGTKAELESLCAEAEKYGIKVIVDIVANHMGNIKGWQNSLSDISPQVGEYWNPDMLTDESFWHINDLQIWMSDGREHFTQGTMGMPDLNTADKRVQKYIADYLKELIDCGVDGYRFDAAKHIETPDDDPSFASDFWPTVLGEANSHYTAKTGEKLYIYGEILNTVGDNFSIDSYTKYMTVTDNSAGHHMLESVRNGQAGNISMSYNPSKSLIWAESHDTYMNESSRYASDKSVVRTWAMIANKKDASALYFVRPYYSKDILEDDRDGAMKGNLQNTLTQAQMGACETYTWASYEVAAINHFRNRMVGVPDNMGSEGSVSYCFRGNGVVLADFNGSGNVSISAHGMANGTYTDEVSGNTFTVSNGMLTGKIDSEWGIAVVYQNVMPNPSTAYPVQIKSSVGDGTVFYGDSLNVEIEAAYADTATYSVTTGESGSFTGKKTITVGQGLNAGESVILTVTGTNKKGTVTKTYTYTKDEYDLSSCIFFKNTKGWSGVNAYMWNDTVSPPVNNAGWPGEKMFECNAAEGIFALKVDASAGYNKVIFSNNGSSQTADIAMGQIGYMYNPDTGTWTEYNVPKEKPTISSSLPSGELDKATAVTFTVKNADKATYMVNGGAAVSFDSSVTLTVGNNEKDVIVIYAENANGSKTSTYTYTSNKIERLSASLAANGGTANISTSVGSSVKLDVSAAGGAGNYTYKFVVHNLDTNTWFTLRDYGSSATYTTKISSAGNKEFVVSVKDGNGGVVTTNKIRVTASSVTEKLTGVLKVNGGTANISTSVGSSVKLDASATGGAGNYTYKYVVHNLDTNTWFTLKDYGSSATYTTKISSAGNKEFVVSVKDGSGTIAATNKIRVTASAEVLTASLKGNGSTANIITMTGSTVKLDVSASGGSGNYTYKYVVHNLDNNTWFTLKDYGSSASYTSKISSAGNKEFVVSVKDGSGKTVATNKIKVIAVS